MGETPSAAANCSARGLAKIAAMMSGGGRWEGREFLNEGAWEAMHGAPIEASMGFNQDQLHSRRCEPVSAKRAGMAKVSIGRSTPAGKGSTDGWVSVVPSSSGTLGWTSASASCRLLFMSWTSSMSGERSTRQRL